MTYREATWAIYTRPLTWLAVVGGFAVWTLVGFLEGLAFIILFGGISAQLTVETLIDRENST